MAVEIVVDAQCEGVQIGVVHRIKVPPTVFPTAEDLELGCEVHTTLGDGVFIGSNSSLQGGITIGPGAYVAMGSAITKDVPAGALAVARARQENKLDYVRKLRERMLRRKDKAAESTGEQAAGSSGGK